MEAYNSRQSSVQEAPIPSSPEASLPGMRGIRFPMYRASEAHPEYPARQNIIGKSNRKMGTVRIVWSTVPFRCCDNIRELLLIMFCKPVGGGLCRSCLQIEKFLVFFPDNRRDGFS